MKVYIYLLLVIISNFDAIFFQADLGDRKTLVLVIGSSKGSSKLKGVQKQRSWETFPPKRKSYDHDSYGQFILVIGN